MKYDFKKIERKWQKRWLKEKIYEPDLKNAKKPFYNLMMFPYPSAEGLHVGNMYAFTGSDIYGRFKRMSGHDVFEPIGLDGFGIHSENYALKIGAHPAKQAKITEKRFYEQLQMVGNGFAWDKKLETYDPEYYKWTQWIFVQMFKRGLAYRKKQAVNWCPKDKTVLADEQVISGECERCGAKVIKKELEQWFFKITDYAGRLLENLPKLDWSEKVKIAQKNWIGKSEGAEIDFEIAGGVAPSYVLLHGYRGSPKSNFFPWLEKELKLRGADVCVPELPNSDNPRVAEQVEFVLKNIPFNENTVLLGHSLGGIVALKVLEKLRQPIRRTVLVASFLENEFLDHDRFDNHTFDWKFEAKRIRANAGDLRIFRDTTDEIVPPDQARKLRDLFGGAVTEFAAQKPHACGKNEPEVLRNCVDSIRVFTTRPDTLFGATYIVLSPEHSLIKNLKFSAGGGSLPTGQAGAFGGKIKNWSEVERYINAAAMKPEMERVAEGKDPSTGSGQSKTGVELKGIKALNPATKEEIPVWVADYVLSGYGTGAIMAVPAHDKRDFEFAKKYELSIKTVILPNEKEHVVLEVGLYEGEGRLIKSDKFTGEDSEKAKWEITNFVGGKRITKFRLRDWLISRQRYWGPPIPMIYCEKCALTHSTNSGQAGSAQGGWQPVPEKDLPVRLPFTKKFRPSGTGKSPLASIKSFYETKCPNCGGKARRETDVSDTFLDSAWYYLRYPSTRSTRSGQVPWDMDITKKWLPVDMYIGGAEHSVLHLLYSRFLSLALHDMKLLDSPLKDGSPKGEPFAHFRAHGLITKDGVKMSKSKGNVVNPDEYIEKFGADAFRMYLMFLAPLEDGGDFRDAGILGITRFLERVRAFANSSPKKNKAGKDASKLLHKTIKKVGEDIEGLRYNTAISALMILLNDFEKRSMLVGREERENFLKLLAPFAPFMAEEIWSRFFVGKKSRIRDLRSKSGRRMFKSIHSEKWPVYDPKLIIEYKFTLVIQINGKMRDNMEVDAGMSEEEIKKSVMEREKVKSFVGGKSPKRIVYVPKKIINIVI